MIVPGDCTVGVHVGEKKCKQCFPQGMPKLFRQTQKGVQRTFVSKLTNLKRRVENVCVEVVSNRNVGT